MVVDRDLQRRGFGPGEDHNTVATGVSWYNTAGSAGASALARITTSAVAG